MMRRTEKSNANSRVKRKANGRQEEHGQLQAKTNQRTAIRDEAKYEEKHSTEERCSQPVPKSPKD